MTRKDQPIICPHCKELFFLQIPLENFNGCKCNYCHEFSNKFQWLKNSRQEYRNSILGGQANVF